jgi:hypothetical protein
MNTEELSDVIAAAIVSGFQKLNKRSVVPATPRALTDPEAGRYLGRSGAFMRQRRKVDQERIKEGLPPLGPKPIYDGRSVFYLVEDLDEYLNRLKAQSQHGGGLHE